MDKDAVSPDSSVGATPNAAAAPAPGDGMANAPVGRTRRELLSGPTRLLLPLALAVIVLYGMKYAGSILNPMLFALFLTMGVSPALFWMRRKGLPPWLSVVVIGVATVILILLLVLVMFNAVNQLNDKLPTYEDSLGDITSGVQTWLTQHGIETNGLTNSIFSAERILGTAKTLISSVAGIFGNVFWLILIFIFMVAEAYAIPARIGELHVDSRFARSFANFSDVTRSFLFTKAWLSAIMAVFCTVIYYAFGIDFALVWGLLLFVPQFRPDHRVRPVGGAAILRGPAGVRAHPGHHRGGC